MAPARFHADLRISSIPPSELWRRIVMYFRDVLLAISRNIIAIPGTPIS